MLAIAGSPAANAWLEFVGALHPAVVHFPLALVVVAAMVEVWAILRGSGHISGFAVTAVRFGALFGVAAAVSGWFNPEAAGLVESADLFLHRWMGIVLAAMLVVLALGAGAARKRAGQPAVRWWRSALLVGALGAVGVGSLGGDMVHGEGHITDALWNAIDQTERAQRSAAESDARAALGLAPESGAPANGLAEVSPSLSVNYAAQVVPILKAHCYECHDERKKKGGVRLDDVARMTTQRKGEWVVKPGDPGASLLVHYASLPADDEERMPPEGEMLSREQLAILATWISEGAHGATAPAPGAVSSQGWSLPERSLTVEELAAVGRAAALLKERGIELLPIASGSSRYSVDASRALPPADDALVESLLPIARFIVELNLSRSAVSDGCAGAIRQLVGLMEIRLDFTSVGDGVGEAASELPSLETANFVGTRLTDHGLVVMGASKSLSRLHVWSSRVSTSGVDAFRLKHPSVRVDDGR